jgi:hypothetical protein
MTDDPPQDDPDADASQPPPQMLENAADKRSRSAFDANFEPSPVAAPE